MSVDNTSALKNRLEAILAAELEKPADKIDADLVKECTDFLLELENKDVNLSSEEIDSSIKKLYVRRNVKKTSFKALLAACLVIIGIFSVTYAMGVRDEEEALFESFLRSVPADCYEPVHNGKYRFANAKDLVFYNSPEEMCSKENVDAVLPGYLPDWIEIKNVHSATTFGRRDHCILFNKKNWSYTFEYNPTYKTLDFSFADDSIECSGKTYYIDSWNGRISINWFDDNGFYYWFNIAEEDAYLIPDLVKGLK